MHRRVLGLLLRLGWELGGDLLELVIIEVRLEQPHRRPLLVDLSQLQRGELGTAFVACSKSAQLCVGEDNNKRTIHSNLRIRTDVQQIFQHVIVASDSGPVQRCDWHGGVQLCARDAELVEIEDRLDGLAVAFACGDDQQAVVA